jgi:hypothetical protein
MEAAPGVKTGEDVVWDWSKKIIFSIGPNDLCLIAQESITKDKIRVVHVYNETTKSLVIQKGQGKYEHTYTLNFSAKTESDNLSIMVPLTSGEYSLLFGAMKTMLPELVGWK